jgi:hypothetical protein
VRQDGGHRLTAVAAALLALRVAASPAAAAPTVSADLDGDGTSETVTASASKSGIKVEVRDARGKRIADAVAPSPAGSVVPFTLTTAPIGSSGSLLEVAAATDSSECVSVWRLRDRALSRVPIRDASGHPLPDCQPPGWTWRWESESGRPSKLVRERTEKVDAGTLTTREAFAFAGFSLDRDAARSGGEINGVPIPTWYRETLFTRPALEKLYARFDLAAMRSEPALTVDTDSSRGLFVLRFRADGKEITAPVDSYAATGGTATLAARAGDRTAHVLIRLAGAGRSVPLEARVEGMGAPYDGTYAPAGSWRGGARQVYRNVADEVASEQLAGTWSAPGGQQTTLVVEGEPPYRMRSGASLFVVDVDAAAPPVDLFLRPASGTGSGWAVALRGPNAMERTPCRFEGESAACVSDGPAETLRRVGARVNVR